LGCFLSQRSFFVGIEVVQHDVKLAVRKGRDDAVHE
jgi:hypothetical protein